MRRDLPGLCRHLVSLICWMLAISTVPVQATDYYISGQKSQSIDSPGAFVGLSTPDGTIYKGPDPIVSGPNQFSFAAPFDTGSSGSVIAAYMANGRSLPLVPGATYDDVGIGGTETFNVSQLTRLSMASVAIGAENSETLSYYSPYGNYNFQVRQSDPIMNVEGFSDPVYVNVIGTPVLNQYVMHVKPNGNTFNYYVDGGIDIGFGFNFNVVPVNYLETYLLPLSTAGSLGVPAAGSQLVLVKAGDSTALHVPLTYKNFVAGSPPVSTSTNPLVPGATLTANGNSNVSDWLFDSGAAVTMVGRNIATDLGLLSQTPVKTTTILGIGGDVRTINGYAVDSLTIPLTDGGHLTFDNIVVFVPNVGDLPADLPGIFGMNLLDNSFDDVNGLGEPITTTSPFSDWYVIPSLQSVPEPGTLVLLAAGLATVCCWRTMVRRRPG